MSESSQTPERETKASEKDITFLDYHAPPLQDGTYRIDAAQVVRKDGTKIDGPYEAQYEFVVTGKQFRLPGDAIHSVYPPAGSTGLYDGHLPHIVLNTTSFPWQRNPGGKMPGGSDVSTPPSSWLALFLFDGTEGIPKTKQGTVADLKPSNRPSGVFYPYDNIAQSPDFDEKTPCSYIDIDADFFNRVAPSTGDLPYLAHVRETDATQQALDHRAVRTGRPRLTPAAGDGAPANGGDSNGTATSEYAVVVGTRLPKAALERASGNSVSTQNTVHLVSLEGYGSYLPEADGSSNLKSGTNAVRLVTMHRWTFNAMKHASPLWKILATKRKDAPTRTVRNPGTGKEEKQKVDAYTDTQPPHFHLPSDELSSDLPEHAIDAVRAGFTPLMYHTRTGDEVAAWYRGPLSPVPVSVLSDEGPYDHADQLLHLDEDTGMFDVSYAAAYQIGRLLALHDGHAAEAIARWRKAKIRRTRQALTRMHLLDCYPPHDTASPKEGTDAAEFQSTIMTSLADALSEFVDDLD